jgi:hypothetical protein
VLPNVIKLEIGCFQKWGPYTPDISNVEMIISRPSVGPLIYPKNNVPVY